MTEDPRITSLNKVLDLLRTKGPSSIKDMNKISDIPVRTLRYAVGELTRDGRIGQKIDLKKDMRIIIYYAKEPAWKHNQ